MSRPVVLGLLATALGLTSLQRAEAQSPAQLGSCAICVDVSSSIDTLFNRDATLVAALTQLDSLVTWQITLMPIQASAGYKALTAWTGTLLACRRPGSVVGMRQHHQYVRSVANLISQSLSDLRLPKSDASETCLLETLASAQWWLSQRRMRRQLIVISDFIEECKRTHIDLHTRPTDLLKLKSAAIAALGPRGLTDTQVLGYICATQYDAGLHGDLAVRRVADVWQDVFVSLGSGEVQWNTWLRASTRSIAPRPAP